MVGDVQGAAGDVLDGEVVEADVQGLGDADGGVEAGCDASVLIAADLARVCAADALG